MPLLAVSDYFFEDIWSRYYQDWLVFDTLARRLVSWQHITFLPLLMVAKFGSLTSSKAAAVSLSLFGYAKPSNVKTEDPFLCTAKGFYLS